MARLRRQLPWLCWDASDEQPALPVRSFSRDSRGELMGEFRSGGWTNDLRCALAYISHLAPKAPLYGTGFSLGANVLAKYLGEEGAATPLKAGIVLGCPWDFYDGHIYLSSSFLRLIYSKAMAKNLRFISSPRPRENGIDAALSQDSARSSQAGL